MSESRYGPARIASTQPDRRGHRKAAFAAAGGPIRGRVQRQRLHPCRGRRIYERLARGLPGCRPGPGRHHPLGHGGRASSRTTRLSLDERIHALVRPSARTRRPRRGWRRARPRWVVGTPDAGSLAHRGVRRRRRPADHAPGLPAPRPGPRRASWASACSTEGARPRAQYAPIGVGLVATSLVHVGRRTPTSSPRTTSETRVLTDPRCVVWGVPAPITAWH